jgi:glutaredoxin 3
MFRVSFLVLLLSLGAVLFINPNVVDIASLQKLISGKINAVTNEKETQVQPEAPATNLLTPVADRSG